MWRCYRVKIKFRERIVAGVPQDPEALRTWLKLRGRGQHYDEELSEIEVRKGARVDGFKRDENGLYIQAYQIKAGLKQGANVIRRAIGFKGQLRARLRERVFITPEKIYLGVKEPSGTLVRALSSITPLGPRSYICESEYVERPEIEFKLWVLDDGIIEREHLEAIFNWLQEEGLGSDRSLDEGKFDVVEFEDLGRKDKISPM